MIRAVSLAVLMSVTTAAAAASDSSSLVAAARVASVSEMRSSIGHIQSLLLKASKDRDPVKLTCVRALEEDALHIYDGAREEARVPKEGRDPTVVADALLAAARRISLLESSAFGCMQQPERGAGSRDIDALQKIQSNPGPFQNHAPVPAWVHP